MITYQDSLDGVNPGMLNGFFVGWPKHPTPERHLQIMKQSDHIVLACDSQSGCVIGFITAVSDGVLSAYIPLLEVLPEFQGRGIGKELTQRMLKELDHLYMIDLICDVDVQPFYAKLGMSPYSGMIKRNFESQSGVGT